MTIESLRKTVRQYSGLNKLYMLCLASAAAMALSSLQMKLVAASDTEGRFGAQEAIIHEEKSCWRNIIDRRPWLQQSTDQVGHSAVVNKVVSVPSAQRFDVLHPSTTHRKRSAEYIL